MKICSRCEQNKPLAEFGWKSIARQIHSSYCLECIRIYAKSHYDNNRQYYAQKGMKTKKLKAQYIRDAKSIPCSDCGQSYPYYVMDFDHREDKRFNVSRMAGESWDRIKEEIAKCDVVCANCHRHRSHVRIKSA